MAELHKYRARKPIIENGRVIDGMDTTFVPSPVNAGHSRAVAQRYTATILGADAEFTLKLDEAEMLHLVSSWLRSHARIRMAKTDGEK